jgi:hypothetical protein
MNEYEVRRAAYEAVAAGDAVIVAEVNGEPVFGLTEKARARAEGIIDAAIRRHGHEAPEKLAEALGVDIEVGEWLVALRQHE